MYAVSRCWAWVVLIYLGLATVQAKANSVEQSMRQIRASDQFVEIQAGQGVVIDLKYASFDNFVGINLYGSFNRAFLHRVAAEKLVQATRHLLTLRPNHRLVIYDALRPRSIQHLLWNRVKGTAQEKYVANPASGSIHNFGFALDLSILDETGRPLDMGTAYDDFTELAQPRLEDKFLVAGKLSTAQIANRRLLRKVMENAGFIQLPIEWWHFDALPRAEVKANYKIIE